MNKVLFVLLSLYALPNADLLAAKVTGATPKKQSTLDLSVEALYAATSMYAKALKAGGHVPDDALKVVHRTHVMRDKRAGDSIMKEIRDVGRYNIIHLPNAIPPFLRAFVTDKTSEVHKMIDQMSLNPHIKEHMKHSVGHYYESKEDQWEKGFKQVIQNDLQAMAQQYRLLDAIEEDATLKGVQFIVIPDVGDTDAAITNRRKDLDTLFQKHPHLTLVVSFNDDVTQVADYFCVNPAHTRSSLPASIKKLSFTGKKLRTAGGCFFSNARSLTSLDFRGLGALTTVGNYFFSNAHSLTSLDFRGLSALQTVGDCFCYDALSLISLDFRGLGALQTVGNYFFSNAHSLTFVDFRGLSALQTVGDCFFYDALSLTSLDFRGLGALTTIENYFFSNAHSLTFVDFRGLSALQTVGDCFFYEAHSLTSLDLRRLIALQTVGGYFCHNALALTSILCHNEKQAQLIRDQYAGSNRNCIRVAQHPASSS